MRLTYEAVDETGKDVTDEIEAISAADATETLAGLGLTVTTISEARRAPAATNASRTVRGQPRRLKNLALLARQLGVLIRTGTPLADALGAIVRQLPDGPWRNVVSDVHAQVEGGSTLSDAMRRYPACFNDICTSLVAAGESSGQLDVLLDRLSLLTRQQIKVQRTLMSAMIYPLLLMVVGIAVVAVMIVFVLPRFSDLFATLDAPLPPSTELLMMAAEFLRGRWWMILIALVAMAVATKFALSRPAGRRGLDRALVQLPGCGHVVRSLLTARFARVLGVLLDSRVPLLEALELVRVSTGNVLYTDLLGQAHEAVVRGESLSAVLATSPLISPYVSEALRHGEQSGQMSPVLLEMAEFMDEENESLVSTMARLVEPIMLLVLGGVVAMIAISIFLPLFDLTSLAGGGA
jgi:type IV pilus assembly protein PilC